MAKLKNPLLSLGAVGRLARDITFARRRRVNIAESTPIPEDARSLAQLSWRHMYQKAVALWHALSATEKQDWESQARSRHMTGFAWFVSQALKPNPGLYLPLQGGTMSGEIDMAKNRLLKLPLPSDSQEPLTLAYYTANIAPYLYHEGAHVYNNANISIPNNTLTTLTFNSERYDTDAIHDPVTNNSRLTCKTAGKYLIITSVSLEANAVGSRNLILKVNNTTYIASIWLNAHTAEKHRIDAATIWELAVNDYVEVIVDQTSGGALLMLFEAAFSPEFMMQKIGA